LWYNTSGGFFILNNDDNENLLVRPAIFEWLQKENERRDKEYAASHGKWDDKKKPYKPKLWASDVGNCARRSALRIQGFKSTVPFEPQSLDYMRIGVILEDETGAALRSKFGDAVIEQMRLSDDNWSGKPDFVLHHGTDNPIIIEHKVTGEKAWYQDGVLPRQPHIGQLVLYWKLYQEKYDIVPKILLFYRAWGHYAEFEILPEPGGVSVVGYVDGVADYRQLKYDPLGEIELLEGYYKSGELPDRLKRKAHGCTFMGKPSCPMYHHCYPED
jgi:hypothetical protein